MKLKLVNRIILRHAADLAGIPQSAEDFADVVRQRGINPAEELTRQSLQQLGTLDYLARAEPTAADEPLYTITAAGLRQILKQVARPQLDPMIWG